MALEPGQIVDGKYRVVRLLGEGGMGTVYEGLNTRIGRRVAIKVLHAVVATQPEFVERFEREARAAARIGSPHVCHVYDLGDLPSGDRYLVMEYLDGMSFEERIASRGRLTTAQLAPIAFELLEGLATMHEARVIHRDLKPANIFLARASTPRGEIVKILDFGVAKVLPVEGEVGTKTTVGLMIGTPLYMSPEQARGAQDIDGRTDLYAASVMFYHALTGQMPYAANTLNELLFKIALEAPRPLQEWRSDIDEEFAAIVHKGLARDPERRFSSARSYQEAIAAWGKKQGRPSLNFALPMERSEPTEPPPAMPSSPVVERALAGAPPPRASEPAIPREDSSPALAKSAPTAWSGARPLSRPSIAAEAASLPPVTDEVEAHAGKGARRSRPSSTTAARWTQRQRQLFLIGGAGALAMAALGSLALSEGPPSSNQATSATASPVADGAQSTNATASGVSPSPIESQLALMPLPVADAAASAEPASPAAAPAITGAPAGPIPPAAQRAAPPVPVDPGRASPTRKASGPPATSASAAVSVAAAPVVPPAPPPPMPAPPESSVRSFRRTLD